VRIVTTVIAAVVIAGGALAASSRQARPVSLEGLNVEDVVKVLRADLQSSRAVIIAKNITLTSEQAAKFWPVFEKYQKEQAGIMEEQLKGIHQYVDTFESLDDAGAIALMKAHLDRDQRMVALRQKWLGEFRKVVPAKLAVRVLQIDRRLSLAYQLEIAAQIPIVE